MVPQDRSAIWTRRIVLLSATMVVALYFVHDVLGIALGLPRKSTLFIFSVSALVAITLVVFFAALVPPYFRALKMTRKDLPEEDLDSVLDEELAPALKGQADPPQAIVRPARFATSVCLGVMVGAVIAGIVQLVARWVR